MHWILEGGIGDRIAMGCRVFMQNVFHRLKRTVDRKSRPCRRPARGEHIQPHNQTQAWRADVRGRFATAGTSERVQHSTLQSKELAEMSWQEAEESGLRDHASGDGLDGVGGEI